MNVSHNTALHIASKYGHCEECALLLQAGAIATARNSDGRVPLDVAGDESTRALLRAHTAAASATSAAGAAAAASSSSLKSDAPAGEMNKNEKNSARRSSMNMIKVRTCMCAR